MSIIDYREAFRDRETWERVTADPDAAQAALDWLTDTVAHVSQQLSDAKAEIAGTRLPEDEYRELMDWRASALNFRRVAESRKRALVAQIKRNNVRRSEESATNQLNRLRSGLWRLCEKYDGATPLVDQIRDLMKAVEDDDSTFPLPPGSSASDD